MEQAQVAQEGSPAGRGVVYPLLDVKGMRFLSAPSQTGQLEPGNQAAGSLDPKSIRVGKEE